MKLPHAGITETVTIEFVMTDSPLMSPDPELFAENHDFPARFRSISLIARGGMGDVYRAYDAVLEREVAIKLLHSDLSATPEGQKRFHREARVLGTLCHPNIVKIHTFGIMERSNQPYQVSELLEGEGLDVYLRQHSTVCLGDLERIACGILDALEYASSNGVVHRDIKPSNIFLTRDEKGVVTPILLDFGIALITGAQREATLTAKNAFLGSPLYMSPEHCRGEQASELSDVYSIGCVLYECLTGTSPFRGESTSETMFKHVAATVPKLHCYVNGALRRLALCSVVESCLQKDPHLRPQSIAKLKSELQLALQDVPADATFIIAKKKKTKALGKQVLLFLMIPVIGFALFVRFSPRKQHMTDQELKAVIRSPGPSGEIRIHDREAAVQKFEHYFDKASSAGGQKERSAELLSNAMFELRNEYWDQKQYDRARELIFRIAARMADFDNGKNRRVDLFVDGYQRFRQLRSSKMDPVQKRLRYEQALEFLKCADKAAEAANSAYGKVAVGFAHCQEFCFQGDIPKARQIFSPTWKLMISEHPVRFGDWRPGKTRNLLRRTVMAASYKTNEDAIDLCRMLSCQSRALRLSQDRELIEKVRERLAMVLVTLYPDSRPVREQSASYKWLVSELTWQSQRLERGEDMTDSSLGDTE